MKDLYIVNKLIYADSVEEALEKEKKVKVSEVFIDSDWRKEKTIKSIDKKMYKQN